MKEILEKIKFKEKGNIFIKMEIYMKEILRITKQTEEAYIFIISGKQKGINMTDILKIGIKREKEFIIIKMEIDMKGISKMI